MDYTIIKKILLVGFFASAMFITYSISSLFGINNIDDNKFVDTNQNYLIVNSKKIKVDDFLKYEKDENINYVLVGNSKIQFNVKYDDYYQVSGAVDNIKGSL